MGDVAELYDRFDPLVALDPTEVGLYVDWQAKLGLDDVKPRLQMAVALRANAQSLAELG